jgi:hypothetical protein
MSNRIPIDLRVCRAYSLENVAVSRTSRRQRFDQIGQQAFKILGDAGTQLFWPVAMAIRAAEARAFLDFIERAFTLRAGEHCRSSYRYRFGHGITLRIRSNAFRKLTISPWTSSPRAIFA